MMKSNVIILLHEIYGVNEFIQTEQKEYEEKGYDVICPNMLGRAPFSYTEMDEAHEYFLENVGFDISGKINHLIRELKDKYDKVFIIGFSVGATVAWKCCNNPLVDGVIGCYGSRIRDYTDIIPACPTLLLFAKRDHFDVVALIETLKEKPNLDCMLYDTAHGFMDKFSFTYDQKSKLEAQKQIDVFLNEYI